MRAFPLNKPIYVQVHKHERGIQSESTKARYSIKIIHYFIYFVKFSESGFNCFLPVELV